MEKLDKEKEDNANTVVHQAEKSEFQVIDLNDLDQLNQEQVSASLILTASSHVLYVLQRELLYAVEKNDGRQFVVLGGANSADINFSIGLDGMFLLLIAAAKAHDEMINLMLQNPRLDINKRDKFGINAFWIAAFYG